MKQKIKAVRWTKALFNKTLIKIIHEKFNLQHS